MANNKPQHNDNVKNMINLALPDFSDEIVLKLMNFLFELGVQEFEDMHYLYESDFKDSGLKLIQVRKLLAFVSLHFKDHKVGFSLNSSSHFSQPFNNMCQPSFHIPSSPVKQEPLLTNGKTTCPKKQLPSTSRKELSESNDETSPPRRKPSTLNNATSSPRKKSSASKDATSSPRKKTLASNVASSPPRKKSSSSNDASSLPRKKSSASNYTSFPPIKKSSASNGTSSSPRKKSSVSNDASSPPRKKSLASNDASSLPRKKSSSSNDTSSLPRKKNSASNDTSFPPIKKSSASNDASSPPRIKFSASNDASSPPKIKSSASNDTSFLPIEKSSASNGASSPQRKKSLASNSASTPSRKRSSASNDVINVEFKYSASNSLCEEPSLKDDGMLHIIPSESTEQSDPYSVKLSMFSKPIQDELLNNTEFAIKQRRVLVRELVNELIKNCSPIWPRRYDTRILARKFQEQFPKAVKFTPNNKGFMAQLYTRLINITKSTRRSIQQQFSNESNTSFETNYDVSGTSELSDNEENEEMHLYLSPEHETSYSFSEMVLRNDHESIDTSEKNIRETFLAQRQDVNNLMPLTALVAKWPNLFQEEGIKAHIYKLLNIDIFNKFKCYFEMKSGFLCEIFNTSRRLYYREIMQKAAESPENLYPCLIELLMCNFGENTTDIFPVFKPGMNLKKILTTLPLHPCLVIMGESMAERSQYLLVADNQVVNHFEPGYTFLNAFVVLFGTYHVLNIKYPESCTITFQFLHRYVCDLHAEPTTKVINSKLAGFREKILRLERSCQKMKL